ncbi:hypothetical protein LCI18_010744 [Fusarium solani-melongenae]|uniref:Uncharacterized protein n=1 Tax=Fusarium solani subsp. cucurbitae TaxID=2747967 RepID=A0ACD3ZEV7_FUSSC|nr:hypothetical protein LCI18_010744 [Fusarium solani-melongenae]
MKGIILTAFFLWVLPALGLPTALDATILANKDEGGHDLSLAIAYQNSTHVGFIYSYQPGVDLSPRPRSVDGVTVLPRTDVNWPGVNERVSVALQYAKITIIRLAFNSIKVIIDNLTQQAIKVAIDWDSGDIDDKVPAGATTSITQNVHQGTSQTLDVRAYLA